MGLGRPNVNPFVMRGKHKEIVRLLMGEWKIISLVLYARKDKSSEYAKTWFTRKYVLFFHI
jgi:hypothetical protein